MAPRTKESARRGGERVGSEGRQATGGPRQRLVGLLTAGALTAALSGAIAIALFAGGGDEDSSTPGPFGTNHQGLEERRVEAGVPTMSDTDAGGEHIHPLLEVYLDGGRIDLPASIGIDPARPPEEMAGLHTHDSTGTIHVENAVDPTLGQFFQIWGVPFSASRLGPYESDGDERVRMWVDGRPSRAFGDLALEDGQEIVIAFGDPRELPPGVEQ